jgi:putative heme-binding domain-containing protein
MSGRTPRALAVLAVLAALAAAAQEPADRPARRVAWTTSRVVGEPDPPPPYVAAPAYPRLTFQRPVLVDSVPGTDRLVVVEVGGRVVTFRDDPEADAFDVALDLGGRGPAPLMLYGLAFHPRFLETRYVYVCYAVGDKIADGTRLSRFIMTGADPPTIDPASERVLLTWPSGGHNGGCLAFGTDGYLYVSAGDGEGPDPPDPAHVGQDMTTLLSKVMRIDVDHAADGRPYAVPADNPFVGRAGMRPEIWALGFRNPWRMSVDPATGDLWLGDVGWELWELVHRVERGGNYGWSVVEGRQPVHPGDPVGPTSISPPVVDHPHSEAASVTGGYVYHGDRLPDLKGAYIYGDFQTGTIWALRYEREARRVAEHRVLAHTPLQLVSFGLDADGELLLVDYERTHQLYRIEPNPDAAAATSARFPMTLSETGVFTSTREHTPAPGVLPYAINVPAWDDGRTADRWLAVPGDGRVEPRDHGPWAFPDGSVLAKTVYAETIPGDPTSRLRVETQILHRERGTWRPYTYAWNDDQSDATLVPAEGADRFLTIRDPSAPGGSREVAYRHAARSECLLCHNPWAGDGVGFGRPSATPLAVSTLQLNTSDQIERWRALGLLSESEPAPVADLPRLSDPRDPHTAPADRARAYLQTNCAPCHRFGGGGAVTLKLNIEEPVDAMLAVDRRPMRGDFGLTDARLLAPGAPHRSVLLYRMAKTGAGHMPPLGPREVDPAGLDAVEAWVLSMGQGGEVTPTPPADDRPADTSAALALARAIDRGAMTPDARARLLATVKDDPRPEVRDLFERFRPPSERVAALGGSFDPTSVLRLAGDPDRGRRLFREDATIQCRSCHVVEGVGVPLGPDLAQAAAKYDRRKLLEHILKPSLSIDDPYRAHVVETTDGRLLVGLVAERTDDAITLRDASNELVRVPLVEVEQSAPSLTSLMPEGLLSGLTPQQAADLLAYVVASPTMRTGSDSRP